MSSFANFNAKSAVDPIELPSGGNADQPLHGFTESIPNQGQHRFDINVKEKISIVSGGIATYLESFVPSATPVPLTGTNCGALFAVLNATDHVERCRLLAYGLQELISDFPDAKQLTILDNNGSIIAFPFPKWGGDGSGTDPHIITSLPGCSSGHYRHGLSWFNIGLIIDVYPTEWDDPLLYEQQNEETLVRLTKHARNITLAQSRLFAYTLTMFGPIVRIFRFDHAGVVVSQPFHILQDFGAVREFLWRFAHPIEDGICQVIGSDPLVRIANPGDVEWVEKALKLTGEGPFTKEDRRSCRWIVTGDPDRPSNLYLAFRPLHVATRLFSKGTIVWAALKQEDHCGTVYAIKDYWRSVGHPAEVMFYDQLCHGDGEPLWKVSSSVLREWPREFFMWGVSHMESGYDLGMLAARSPEFRQYMENLGHITSSVTVHDKNKREYERTHTRIVLKTYGKAIWRFNNAKHLIEAVLDAVKGHRNAYEKGVLHRDISEGNILIAIQSRFRGFIGDFDCALNWKVFLESHGLPPIVENWERLVELIYVAQYGGGSRKFLKRHSATATKGYEGAAQALHTIIKGRVGTARFMAIEILEDSAVHEARHDLESFYWVLLWIVLRHTRHNLPSATAWEVIFGAPTFAESAQRKRAWLTHPEPLAIADNEPLSQLLNTLGELCRRNCLWPGYELVPLGYDTFIQPFMHAIEVLERPWYPGGRPVWTPNPVPVSNARASSPKMENQMNSMWIVPEVKFTPDKNAPVTPLAHFLRQNPRLSSQCGITPEHISSSVGRNDVGENNYVPPVRSTHDESEELLDWGDSSWL